MRRLVLLATLVVTIAACGGGGDDADASLTTTTSSDASSTTTTTADPTTTTAPTDCDNVSIPAGATDVSEELADVDGDGDPDELRSYLVGDADWHLQVELAAGGGADLAITTFGAGAVAVLGGADVDGDGADEIWARTGSGASATILGLARFAHCALTRVTFTGGDPAEIPVGGSVGTASGLECEAHVDPTADLTGYTATNIGDDQYDVSATEYALEGTTLAQKGTETSIATAGDDTFARATTFVCGNLSL